MHRASVVGVSVIFLSALYILGIYFLTDNPNPPKVGKASVTATYKRKVAFITIAGPEDIEQLQILVGSLQYFHVGSRAIIYAFNFTREQLRETRNWEHVEVFETQDLLSDDTLSVEDYLALALHDAAELYGTVLYLSPDYYLRKTLSGIYELLQQNGFVAHIGLSGSKQCCDFSVVGFVHDSRAYENALIPTATCVISNTCRGQVNFELTTSLAFAKHAATATDAAPAMRRQCPCEDLHVNSPDGSIAIQTSEAKIYKEHLSYREPPDNAAAVSSDHDSHNAADSSHDNGEKTKVCLLVPSTTMDRNGKSLGDAPEELPLFNVLVKTFVNTVENDFDSGRFSYSIYLGVDDGDVTYDNHERMDEVRQIFNEMTQDLHVHLKVKKFGSENRGKPAWIWNGLFDQAVADGCEYAYQLNDDIELLSNDWTSDFVDKLSSNPLYQNLGIAGASDVGNPRTITQSFVSKLHRDIFGFYFPPSLENWFSDDWISHVYDEEGSTFKFETHSVRNRNDKGTRYKECVSCGAKKDEELRLGRKRLRDWLEKNRHE